MIGLPVGLTALTLWVAAIYWAKIAIAPAIAALLLRKDIASDMGSFAGALALGLAVFWFLRLIPGVGLVVSFLVAIVGLGALGM